MVNVCSKKMFSDLSAIFYIVFVQIKQTFLFCCWLGQGLDLLLARTRFYCDRIQKFAETGKTSCVIR